MLHIILLILKLIGGFVLIVLGIILLLLLLILLVPIRYRVSGSYYEKIKGKVKVTWLLHILSVTFLYEEDLSIIIRLFGFRIFKPKKADAELIEEEDFMVQTTEVKEPEPRREDWSDRKEIRKVNKESKKTLPLSEEKKEVKKESLWYSWIEKLKFLFRKICDTLKAAKDKTEELKSLINNKDNQKTVKLFFKQLKKLIRHIFPIKGNGSVTFGFEDPYLTGQVLTYISAIYPLCHKRLNIYPVFDQAVFTAEGTFRGRIQCGKVLAIGIRMYMNKNFRVLLKKWL